MLKTYGPKSVALLISIMVFCFILVLSGCTKERVIVVQASTTTAEATTTTEEVTTTTEEEVVITSPEISSEDLFLMTVKSGTNLDAYFTDRQLIDLAKSACQGFDNGLTKDDVIRIIFEVGTEYNLTDQQMIDLAGAVGAGVAAFCPENSYLID
jgi:hypothetical protein